MKWQSIKEYIPALSILSVGLISLGLAKEIFYYDHFNVEIQNFISPSELILVLSDKIILILFFTGFFVLLAHSQMWAIYPHIYKQIKDKKESKWKAFRNQLVISLFCLVGASLFYFLNVSNIAIITALIGAAIFVYPFIYFVIESEYETLTKKKINKYSALSILTIVICLSIVADVSFSDIQGVERGKYSGTKIFTNNGVYISDSSHYYIGKTVNYYFFHYKDSSTIVIPEREVIKFELRKAF